MQLTHQDLYIPAQAGILRRISAIAKKRPEPNGSPTSDLWGIDIESCIAEYLVSQVLDLSWKPFISNPGELIADVGKRIQVRHTATPNGHLLMHKKDPSDQNYVLVTGSMINQKIAGWIPATEGKLEKYWNTNCRTHCFWIPQSALQPITELIK